MTGIGVRELKIHTSHIIRSVKEKGMHYIVTHRGHPVAAIVPVDEAPSDLLQEQSWDELVELGDQISLSWQSSKSSAEILSDMR